MWMNKMIKSIIGNDYRTSAPTPVPTTKPVGGIRTTMPVPIRKAPIKSTSGFFADMIAKMPLTKKTIIPLTKKIVKGR